MQANRADLIQEIFENMIFIQKKISSSLSPADCSVPPAQAIVLHIVASHESLSIKGIAELLQVSSSAATQMVDTLVKSGLLLREADAKDRRTLKIRLTDLGESKFVELRKLKLNSIGQTLSPLSDQELKTFRDLLWTIMNNTKKFEE
ncbi:MAG: MarR family transcriptional regulator [Bacillota bacterium]|nr:MarR family transcriptional regulator [Bacillota bacterium]